MPTVDSELLPYALDAGAGGIILPHTETAAQAQALVSKMLFPTGKADSVGHRSFPPAAWMAPFQTQVKPGQTIYSTQNAHVAPIVQVESKKGAENIDDILAVDGIAGWCARRPDSHPSAARHAR